MVDQARPLAAAKEWKQVRPLAEEALKLDPKNAQALALLGFSLHGQKRWAAAYSALQQAVEAGLEPKVVARAAAECADRRKDRRGQAKWWLVVAKEEKDAGAALKSARASDSPVEAYELAAQLGKIPKDDLAPFAGAEQAAGNLSKASPLFDQAAAAFPDKPELALEGARIRLGLKDLAGAEERVRKLYAARPNEPGVLLLSAEIANAKGDAKSERTILDRPDRA